MPGSDYASLVSWAHDSKTLGTLHSYRLICQELVPSFEAFKSNVIQTTCLALVPGVVAGTALRKPGAKAQRSDLDDGTKTVEEYFKTISAIERGLGGLFFGVLTGAWTAFETLMGDLWRDALNACPNPLAELRGGVGRIWGTIEKKSAHKGSPRKKDANANVDEARRKSESKLVSLDGVSEITEGTFDLSKLMGTLFRANDKFDFSVLAKVREAYSAAFWYYADEIDEILSDRAIDALNLVRNLLVHNAGKADKIYVRDIVGTPAPVLKRDEYLKLDGKKVVELTDPVVGRATNLIAAVDRWIQNEKDGKHSTKAGPGNPGT